MDNDKAMVIFKQGAIEITQEQKETFVGFISTQSPTEPELMLHFDFCARKGVHPLERLIYFTKRNGKYTPITSIDYMRMRAESSGAYAGSDDAVFKGIHKVGQREYPITATVTVWKIVDGQRCPFTATSRWNEYAPDDLSSNMAFMWRTKPYVMLGKCAEALALRKAFPGQLQGLYTQEEFDQSDIKVVSHKTNESHVDVVEAEVSVVSSDATQSATEEAVDKGDQETKKSDPNTIVVWDGKTQKPPQEMLSIKAVESFKKLFANTDLFKVPQHLTRHLKDHFGAAKVADLTYEKATALAKHLRGEGDDPRWYAPKESHAVTTPEKTAEPGNVPDVGVDLDKLASAWETEMTGVQTEFHFANLGTARQERINDMMALVQSGAIEKGDIAGMVSILMAE